MHWPVGTVPGTKKAIPDWDFTDTWREMQKLLDTGKVRNIGVSNFGIRNLEKLLNDKDCKVRLVASESWRSWRYADCEDHPRRQPG